MTPEDLVGTSVRTLTAAFGSGALSPVEALQATLDHAEATNGALNALFSIRPEEAMENARASERYPWLSDLLEILDQAGSPEELMENAKLGLNGNIILVSVLYNLLCEGDVLLVRKSGTVNHH